MKQAIMVGAGNIGRGFIGAILANGSYHVTFADVNMELIGALNEEKQYCVHVQDKNPRTFCVTDVDGVSSAGDALVEPICTAQLITTAVGLRILPIVAKPIAAGIAATRIHTTLASSVPRNGCKPKFAPAAKPAASRPQTVCRTLRPMTTPS